ncbi:MAG: hypothetical protein ABJM06_12350 [Gilvibacter sp.]
MERRQFIILSAIGAAAIGTSVWYFKYYNSEIPNSLDRPHALSHIWDTDMISAMGEAYRKQLPSEDNESRLRQLLRNNQTDQDAAIEALKNTIKSDFISGNTLVIEGWILSQAEARQCALYSIISG